MRSVLGPALALVGAVGRTSTALSFANKISTTPSSSRYILQARQVSYSAYSATRLMSTTDSSFKRKKGVAAPSEIADFVRSAGPYLVVVDARNPDFTVEPGDGESSKTAPLAQSTDDTGYRPNSYNLIYDRTTQSMDLSKLPDSVTTNKQTPIITHCGGGGRGQKAKDFLIANGFENVMNGGGPEDPECWTEFGER
mmetsp:Transcript_38807/g.39231  ORF Transcript_38807/g.39231 Transcript_38807/m.39231 type:complete len:196 (-) Transcript_38807:318-905(-)